MTPERQPAGQPTPALLFDTINAHQRTEAIKSAIELSLFTAIAEGKTTAKEIAEGCGASLRGTRILCDYLVIIGFLTKQNEHYALTPDSRMFLDKRSPAYMGTVIDFMLSPMVTDNFKQLTAAVKKGGTASDADSVVAPDHPVWVKFARAMAPMMAMPSQLIAQLADPKANAKLKILDIAAGHGLYGLAFAKHNQQAEVTAVDWPNVLEVAKENARTAGVSDRYHTLRGSAFDVDYGTGYDIVLLTNFLHHFDAATCETLLRKAHAALADGGRAVTLEFVPNDDRVSPPQAAAFSMMMLGLTPSGDAYTFSELERMFGNAGFTRSELHELPPTIQRVVISHR
ncbi:MAG TPA: class I SAM-dependent methyltransferase [Pyrinomonadaceae bacterium]|nr:class I SAM-dependent methyltransferase [Pyrinomonadaceae bacterium]